MGKHIFFVSTESKKWWSFLWEDVEAASRSESCSNHPGDDKKEGKKQERVAAFNTGNYGKEVIFIENLLQKAWKLLYIWIAADIWTVGGFWTKFKLSHLQDSIFIFAYKMLGSCLLWEGYCHTKLYCFIMSVDTFKFYSMYYTGREII